MSLLLRLGLAAALCVPILARAATPPLTAPGRLIVEGHSGTTKLVVPITLSDAVSRPQTIHIWTSTNTAGPNDYLLVDYELTYGPGETEKNVTILIYGDELYEQRETFYLTFGSESLGWYSVLCGIENDDPIPVLSIEDVTVTEGSTATMTVKSTQPITGNVSYRTISASANAGEDFVGTDGTLAFKNETSKTIQIATKSDGTTELDEQLALRLSIAGSSPFTLGRELANIHLLDDDAGIGPDELQIAAGSSRRAIVRIASASDTSTKIELKASSDAVTTAPSVTIPAGSKTATFDVEANLPNRRETVTATFPNGSTAKTTVITYGGAQLVVNPKDLQLLTGQTVSVRASLNPASTKPVTIGIGENGTVQAPSSFVIPAGGEGSFDVKAVSTGTIVITLVLPQELGGDTASISGKVTSGPAGLSLQSVTPAIGSTAGNTEIVLAGSGFRAECTVEIGGVRATAVQVADDSKIYAKTPPRPADTYNVAVRCGAQFAHLPQAFRYVDTAPVARLVTPTFGTTAGGTHVRVSGSTFDPHCWIYFGDKAATGNVVHDASTITAIAPPHAAGVVDVRVVCDGGLEAKLGRAFAFDEASDPMPLIARFTPETAAPGDVVTITGTRFRPTDAITIDGIPAQVLESLPDARTIVVPDVPQGNVSIDMLRNGATSTSGPVFTIGRASPPRASYVSRDALPAGAELEIRGLGFRNGYAFALGDATLQTISLTPTIAVVRVPEGLASGVYDLEVRDTANLPVTYGPKVDVTESGLALTAVSERCASTSGGLEVTLTGTGFAPGASVTFDGVAATDLVFTNPTTLRARVPARTPGDATIAVTAGDVTTTLTNAFQYVSPHDPRGCGGTPRTRAVRH